MAGYVICLLAFLGAWKFYEIVLEIMAYIFEKRSKKRGHRRK